MTISLTAPGTKLILSSQDAYRTCGVPHFRAQSPQAPWSVDSGQELYIQSTLTCGGLMGIAAVGRRLVCGCCDDSACDCWGCCCCCINAAGGG